MQTEAVYVMKDLRKKNFILPQNSAELPQKAEVATQCRIDLLKKKGCLKSKDRLARTLIVC